MSETESNLHRRKSDDSVTSWLKDKVVAPLIVAFIVGSSAGGIALYKKIDDLSVQMTQQYTVQEGKELELRVSATERELAIVRAQMVGWDTIKRLEQGLSLIAASGKTNEAMKVIALTLRQELEARKEK